MQDSRKLKVDSEAAKRIVTFYQNSNQKTSKEIDDPTSSKQILNEPYECLKSLFGYQEWRGNQEAIINATMNGKDVFATMPTGGGKSLYVFLK